MELDECGVGVSEPEPVFGASLTAAQVLLPGSQASISSMLLEGHSLLALSTIMFRPGGIDQVNKTPFLLRLHTKLPNFAISLIALLLKAQYVRFS